MSETAQAHSSRTPHPATSQRTKTLLVDDSPIMLELLRRIMDQEPGFEIVGTAGDGHQALLSAASLGPELVLMDLHMPHLNGAQVTQCLKEFDHPPAVFIVTANDIPAARQMCAAAGADAFITKSADLSAQLHSKLHEWLSKRPPLSNGAAKSSGKRTSPLTCNARIPAAEHFGHPHCDQPVLSSPAARACASRRFPSRN